LGQEGGVKACEEAEGGKKRNDLYGGFAICDYQERRKETCYLGERDGGRDTRKEGRNNHRLTRTEHL